MSIKNSPLLTCMLYTLSVYTVYQWSIHYIVSEFYCGPEYTRPTQGSLPGKTSTCRETKKYQDWKVPLKNNKWQMRLPSSVKYKCGYCIPSIWPADKHYRTSIYNYSTFIRGMTQPPYSLSPFIHQIVSEVMVLNKMLWLGWLATGVMCTTSGGGFTWPTLGILCELSAWLIHAYTHIG